ncbi:hypothetical protein GCM10027589_15200 [Actinocorallia lasiicapitis]
MDVDGAGAGGGARQELACAPAEEFDVHEGKAQADGADRDLDAEPGQQGKPPDEGVGRAEGGAGHDGRLEDFDVLEGVQRAEPAEVDTVLGDLLRVAADADLQGAEGTPVSGRVRLGEVPWFGPGGAVAGQDDTADLPHRKDQQRGR